MQTKASSPARRYVRPSEKQSAFSWDLNPTTILAIFGAVVSALYGYWNTQRATEDGSKELVKIRAEMQTKEIAAAAEVEKLKAEIENIQKSGTDYGRSAYSTQSVERQQVKKDLADVQSSVATLIPTVTEIAANVRWLMHAQGADTAANDDLPILRHKPVQKPQFHFRRQLQPARKPQ